MYVCMLDVTNQKFSLNFFSNIVSTYVNNILTKTLAAAKL